MLIVIMPSDWIPLLSAVVGAVIAGGSAAWVAMTVLRRTQAGQSALAKTQLDKQHEDLQLQLEEQKKEASLAREVSTRSDLIALLSSHIYAMNHVTPTNFGDLNTRTIAAIQRWRMTLSVSKDSDLRDELKLWPMLFQVMQMVSKPGNPGDNGRAIFVGIAEQLTQVAVNYREVVSGVDWGPEESANQLCKMRELGMKYANTPENQREHE